MTHALEIEADFWSRVDYDPHDTERCWPWKQGGVQRGYAGYNLADVNGARSRVRAHRLAYVLTFGEIPPYAESRVEIDHLCHDPATCKAGDACQHRRCCNPHHMRLSRAAENGAPDRAVYWQTLKQQCPQGHEYTAANTCIRPNGHRVCRACNRNRARARKLRMAVAR